MQVNPMRGGHTYHASQPGLQGVDPGLRAATSIEIDDEIAVLCVHSWAKVAATRMAAEETLSTSSVQQCARSTAGSPALHTQRLATSGCPQEMFPTSKNRMVAAQ